MNKTQLVDALAERLGDRRTAATAVDGLLATIVATVRSGDTVSITGFGVFEGRARAARTGRNPRTGEAIAVPAATVPAFRPGAGFRAALGQASTTPAPRSATRRTAATAAPAVVAEPEKPAKAPAKKGPAKKATPKAAAAAPAPAKAAAKAPATAPAKAARATQPFAEKPAAAAAAGAAAKPAKKADKPVKAEKVAAKAPATAPAKPRKAKAKK